MPSYFPKPDAEFVGMNDHMQEDDSPQPLLLLEQEYAERHEAKVEAVKASSKKASQRAFNLQQEQRQQQAAAHAAADNHYWERKK